jgi:hypothetical protein
MPNFRGLGGSFGVGFSSRCRIFFACLLSASTMIVIQEAIAIIFLGVVLYYVTEYTSHHKTHQVFDASEAGSHEDSHCPINFRPVNHQYLTGQWGEPSLNSEDTIPGECFFSKNYDEARVSFSTLAQAAGADELFDLPEIEPNVSSQVAIFRGNPHKFLLHFSGTHGVEAYAGSAIQFGILQHLKALREQPTTQAQALPTIVLVHPMNPFGFKYNRRTNEENIDLNRNFLTDAQWEMVRARDPNYASYVDVQHILNPTSKPFRSLILNEIFSLLQMGYVSLKYGVTSLKRAMVSGNYHFNQGYGFGGFAHAKSTKNVIQLFVERLKLPQEAEAIVMLDVHTGLGPLGVDTLFYANSPNFGEAEIEKIFPSESDRQNPTMVIGGLKASSLGGNHGKKKQEHIQGIGYITFFVNETVHSLFAVCLIGTKSRAKADAENVASGYDLTIGTTEALCTNFLAPHLHDEKRVCVSQEFGTVPVMMVGKVRNQMLCFVLFPDRLFLI